MRFALIFICGFMLSDCQRLYFSPLPNPLLYQAKSFPVPFPWYHFAAPQSSNDEMIMEQQIVDGSDAKEASFRGYSPNDNPLPRFLFNNGLNNNNFLFGVNTNFAFKTRVYTVIRTKTLFTTALCLQSSNVLPSATTCSRRRRDLEAFLSGLDKYYNSGFNNQANPLQPSPTFTVETTAIPIEQGQLEGSYASSPMIASSKVDSGEHQADGVLRSRRFFTAARLTFTSWKFTTTTVQQPADVRFLLGYQLCPIGNQQPVIDPLNPPPPPFSCAFACIPPGYSVCTTKT